MEIFLTSKNTSIMELKEIIKAVKNNLTVCWKNDNYKVIFDDVSGYMIKSDNNENYIALTHQDGKTLNGQPEDFYIINSGLFARKCDCCGKGMNKGYFDNDKYYCSDRCLLFSNSNDTLGNKDLYTMEKWENDCKNHPDICYYTEWEIDEEEELYNHKGQIVNPENKMVIRNVAIGDKFILPQNRKSKRVSEVIDFIEYRSLMTNEVVGYRVVSQHDFLGQKITTNTVAPTLLRNKIKE